MARPSKHNHPTTTKTTKPPCHQMHLHSNINSKEKEYLQPSNFSEQKKNENNVMGKQKEEGAEGVSQETGRNFIFKKKNRKGNLRV